MSCLNFLVVQPGLRFGKSVRGRGLPIAPVKRMPSRQLLLRSRASGVGYGESLSGMSTLKMTGFGGTTQRMDVNTAAVLKPSTSGRVVKVDFTSTVHSTMPWTFTPTQRSVTVVPGETALAFYTVRNNSDVAITGVATYNVFPPKAGLYFNKIQCFCFEEQRLGPQEEIDMPVFFLLDPDMENDESLSGVNNITLSYTFFKTGDESS